MILWFILSIISFLYLDFAYFFYFILLGFRKKSTKDFLLFKVFFNKKIVKFFSCLPLTFWKINSFWSLLWFFFPYDFFLNNVFLWQPLFKRHSYYMYFRSNREFWLEEKYKK